MGKKTHKTQKTREMRLFELFGKIRTGLHEIVRRSACVCAKFRNMKLPDKKSLVDQMGFLISKFMVLSSIAGLMTRNKARTSHCFVQRVASPLLDFQTFCPGGYYIGERAKAPELAIFPGLFQNNLPRPRLPSKIQRTLK